MAREIPEVVRAVAGLTATVLDEARNLPRSLFGLPVRLLGVAMQTSLKLQQHYSGLVARGDEVFTGLWGESEPGLATFDEDLPASPAPAARTANRGSALTGSPIRRRSGRGRPDRGGAHPGGAERGGADRRTGRGARR